MSFSFCPIKFDSGAAAAAQGGLLQTVFTGALKTTGRLLTADDFSQIKFILYTFVSPAFEPILLHYTWQ